MQKSPDAFRTISEVADWLETPAHVLRFWESRFTQIKPIKRAGGRRYYRPADMALLGGIKKLLHDDGMTIRGVQKLLREHGVKYVASMSPDVEGYEPPDSAAEATDSPIPPAPMAEDVPQAPETSRVERAKVVHFSREPEKDAGVRLTPVSAPAPSPETTPEPDAQPPSLSEAAETSEISPDTLDATPAEEASVAGSTASQQDDVSEPAAAEPFDLADFVAPTRPTPEPIAPEAAEMSEETPRQAPESAPQGDELQPSFAFDMPDTPVHDENPASVAETRSDAAVEVRDTEMVEADDSQSPAIEENDVLTQDVPDESDAPSLPASTKSPLDLGKPVETPRNSAGDNADNSAPVIIAPNLPDDPSDEQIRHESPSALRTRSTLSAIDPTILRGLLDRAESLRARLGGA